MQTLYSQKKSTMQAVTITQIAPFELEALIKASLKEILDNHLSPAPPPNKDILNIAEACLKLGIAKQTMYALVSSGKVPHMKRSKRLYFSDIELTEWLKGGKRLTTAEANANANNFLTSKK